MRKQKPVKQKSPQRESAITDKTPVREKFWTDISVAITNATQLGIPRVTIIADMLSAADNIAQICEQEGDDMSSLEGLLA